MKTLCYNVGRALGLTIEADSGEPYLRIQLRLFFFPITVKFGPFLVLHPKDADVSNGTAPDSEGTQSFRLKA